MRHCTAPSWPYVVTYGLMAMALYGVWRIVMLVLYEVPLSVETDPDKPWIKHATLHTTKEPDFLKAKGVFLPDGVYTICEVKPTADANKWRVLLAKA